MDDVVWQFAVRCLLLFVVCCAVYAVGCSLFAASVPFVFFMYVVVCCLLFVGNRLLLVFVCGILLLVCWLWIVAGCS